MMNRMRTFFKNMLVNASKGKPLEPTRKPTQIVYFEEQLTRLMKTVPGINDQQVKEIVEYLSSEDTWSDSYDSSAHMIPQTIQITQVVILRVHLSSMKMRTQSFLIWMLKFRSKFQQVVKK